MYVTVLCNLHTLKSMLHLLYVTVLCDQHRLKFVLHLLMKFVPSSFYLSILYLSYQKYFILLTDNLGNACLTSFFVTGAWDHSKLLQSLKAYQNAVSVQSKNFFLESISSWWISCDVGFLTECASFCCYSFFMFSHSVSLLWCVS